MQSLSPEQRELLQVLLENDPHVHDDRDMLYVAPRNPTEEKLAAIWSSVLGVPRVGIHDNFFHLGGDSIQCIRVAARAREAGVRISTDLIFQHPTVAEISATAQFAEDTAVEQAPAVGPVMLTPIQRWFLDLDLPDPEHWNQVMRFEVDDRVTEDALRLVCDAVVERHDSLRLRFEYASTGWVQTCEPVRPAAFRVVDDAANPLNSAMSAISLSYGQLFSAILTRGESQRPRELIIAAHHLAVDGVSFRILAEDLQAGCEQALAGNAVSLPTRGASFPSWAKHCNETANLPHVHAQVDYWLSLNRPPVAALPVSGDGPNLEESAETVTVSLDAGTTTALLRLCPSHYRARFADVFLAAVAHQIARWAKFPNLLLDCESHGREELDGLDLSRVTGWFTAMYPMALTPGATFSDTLSDIKRRVREIPGQGLGFGLLRYCAADTNLRASMASLPKPQVLFNYLGQFDDTARSLQWLRYIPGQMMASYGPTNPRAHVWQIFGAILSGELKLQWTFSRNLHTRETIEALASAVVDTLTHVATGKLTAAALSTDDFPDADLTREDLRVIIQAHI